MRGSRRWIALVGLLVAGAWLADQLSARPERISAASPDPGRLESHQAATPVAAPQSDVEVKPATLPRTSVRLDVYPAVKATTDAAGPAETCRIEVTDGRAPWSRWAEMSGPRISAKSTDQNVPVFAVRTPVGVAILAANHGASIAAVHAEVRLGRGVYRSEKHNFGISPDAPAPPSSERLQAVLLKQPGRYSKPVWLKPNTAAVLVITDGARDLNRALQSAKQALRGAASDAPRAYRLIRGPFGEASPKIEKIAADGVTMSPRSFLQRAERAAVSLSHAQTVSRNQRTAGVLRGETGESVQNGLDRLEASLSEMIASSLGLVPNVEWGESSPDDSGRKPLTVTFGNLGAQPLRVVKIGLGVPEDCRVSPEDQAVFRAVRPGETVRATFMLRPAAPEDLRAVRAEIAYLAGRAPARLRLAAD